MGFADTGKLGVAVRPRVYSDRLPKNVAQPGLEGKKLFQIGGVNPTIFNLDAALHAKITQSEYFKCLYVFKTFDKVVDLIYEKVTYVEPFTHRGASTKRSLQKQPSSAFCLLLKLFHLRLTEDQVRELLDHPDSTYLRVMGMLYVRYGGDPSIYWKWLGEYCDDLEEFSPGIQQMHTTTVGAFARRLLTVAELDLYGTPLPPVGPILEYRFSVHLAAHDDVAKRAVVNKPRLSTLAVGASGFLCCARDFYGEDDGEEDAIVWRAGLPTQIKRPPRGRLRRTDAHEYSTETAPASCSTGSAKGHPTMSLQRPLHSPPKAEHNLFVPDKEQHPSPPRETQSQKPKAIPGYRGFIRGSQHYYGLTDGEVSRRAPSHNFAPTPAGNPHEEAGPRVATESLDSAAPARVLGYSGHIPGRVTRYAETFGRTVENSFAEHRKSASPSKHRIVSTSTTEMPSGTNTIVLDKDEVRFREARALGKTLALRHELEASPGYTGCIRGAQHFFGSTFARVQKEAKTIYPQKGILSGTDTERIPRDRINGYTGHLPGEKSAYGSTFGRTCGDCLDEFQASVSKTAAAGYRILPLADFSVASPIKRE